MSARSRVAVFVANLPVAPSAHARLLASLAPDERVRAARHVRADDRTRFETGRGLLREILGEALTCAAADVRLGEGPRGKPCLVGEHAASPVRFNLSHSGARLVVAVSLGPDVGVDVETVRPLDRGRAIARRVFSPGELAVLDHLDGPAWIEAFFRGWTRKEAVVKAMGVGLAFPLRRITVTIGADEPPRVDAVLGDPTASGWSLARIEAGPGYEAALAALGPAIEVAVTRIVL